MARPAGAWPTRICPVCNREFRLRRYGDAVKWRYNRKQVCCSPSCGSHYAAGTTPESWGIDKNGYRCRYRGTIAAGGRKYEFEHRLVMEQKLGRKLHSHETIHHKNGDRADNHPDNLELWLSRHGKGQRASDLAQLGSSSGVLSFGS